MPFTLEICAASAQSCLHGEAGGAHRVELCDNLYEGGTTPSYGLLEWVRRHTRLQVFAMIRPRGGDFCYSPIEIAIMERDIEVAKSLGAHGVVFGALLADGSADLACLQRLVAAARPMQVTVHRAIDMAADPLAMLAACIELGVDRVLTSGGRMKAIEGLDLLRQMVIRADGRIGIMAGSGVNADNVATLAAVGIREFHLSAKVRVAGNMVFRNPRISMGNIPQIPEYERDVTDPTLVRAVRDRLDELLG